MMFTLSLLAAPLLAGAQPAGQMHRIGLLRAGVTSGVASMDFERNFEAFRQGLRDLGWVEGQNLTIEYRTTEGHTERLPALAAELVGLPVEVIVTMGLEYVRDACNFSLLGMRPAKCTLRDGKIIF